MGTPWVVPSHRGAGEGHKDIPAGDQDNVVGKEDTKDSP